MAIADLTRKAVKLVSDNSPAILTALSAAGVVSTAVLSARAAVHSNNLLYVHEDNPDFTVKEKIQHTWKYWVPPVLAAGLTITGIVCSNRISSKRAAAMASAYTVVETAFGHYKEEVLEVLGETKEQKVRDNVAQKRVQRDAPTDSQITIIGAGKVLCYETYSGRYFESNMEKIRAAENEMGYSLIHEGYADLNEWFHLIGLETTPMGDQLGWNVDRKFEIAISSVIAEDKPVMVVDYKTLPKADFTSFH